MTVRAVSNNPTSPFYNANMPNLTGQSGQLLTVLDAALVNGVSGFTALGWTVGQNTTNKKQYIMAAGGTGYSIWIDDAAPGAGGAREARCAGFKTMSGTTPTGTGQWPTSSQSTIGFGALVIRKSTTADSTVRYYTLYGDGHTFYMAIETGDYTNVLATFTFGFGDFFTYCATDIDNCMIMARPIENTAQAVQGATANYYEPMPMLNIMGSGGLSTTIPGQYVAANFSGIGGSLAFGKHSDAAKMGGGAGGDKQIVGYQGSINTSTTNQTWTNQFAYPNPEDNGLYMAPIFIHHGSTVRGYLKGLWCPLQHQPLTHNDTFSGSNNLSGKSFLAINTNNVLFNGSSPTSGFAGQFFFETSDTWN